MDKNGKLFGKINLIDLLVLLVVLVAIVAVALKMTGRLGPKVVQTGTDIVYTVRTDNIYREVYEDIQDYIETAKAAGDPGDRLMANGELLNGYITDVTAIEREQSVQLETNDGYVSFYGGENDRVDLVFTIQGHVDNNVKTELGTQEVRTGKTHIVKTTHFEIINGTILTCEWAGGTGAGY